MNINRELLSKAIDMLRTFAADQVALDPSSRGEYSHKQCVKVIEALEEKLTAQQPGPVFDGSYCDVSEKERQAYNNGVLAGHYDPEAKLLVKKPDLHK